MAQTYTVVVTGPIGAGKSTVTEALSKRFGFPRIPEFVETQVDGLRKLEDWASGKLSDADFQRYIVDSYDKSCSITSNCRTRIFERSPWDGYQIFSRMHEGLEDLVNRANEVMERWSIPAPRPEVVKVVNAEESPAEVLGVCERVVEKDLAEGNQSRVIYLRISGRTSRRRTLLRGRSGEDSYGLQYLSEICRRYDRALLNSGE